MTSENPPAEIELRLYHHNEDVDIVLLIDGEPIVLSPLEAMSLGREMIHAAMTAVGYPQVGETMQ